MSEIQTRDNGVGDARDCQSLIVTTTCSNTDTQKRTVLELAAWFDCPMVSRDKRSIDKLCRDERADAVLVADSPPKLYHRLEPGKALFFHPGMAMQRVLQIRQGEQDRMLRAAQIQPGDVVLDATLGLGVDALVFAEGVGEKGRVVACESSALLARLFTYAIQTRYYQPAWLAALLNRVQVEERLHQNMLRNLPDKSVDVVYFDPMFRSPFPEDSNLTLVRLFADTTPLSDSAIKEAQRVARRTVMVKERLSSGVFERFSLVPDKTRARFAYGVLRL